MAFVIPPPGPTGKDYRGCRALVVDSHRANRRLLSQMLEREGLGRVAGASSPAEGLGRVADEPFNLMFLDWSQDLDAVSVLATLRALTNPNRMLPVVVTTGFTERRHLLRVINAGANEFIPKPYTAAMVASRLHALVHQPRVFIRSDSYFGPDRRRWRDAVDPAEDRRTHQNWCGADRRRDDVGPPGPERRQDRPGYVPSERRGSAR
ncbi:MAG: response regulator [Solirubrobacterales bacterium]